MPIAGAPAGIVPNSPALCKVVGGNSALPVPDLSTAGAEMRDYRTCKGMPLTFEYRVSNLISSLIKGVVECPNISCSPSIVIANHYSGLLAFEYGTIGKTEKSKYRKNHDIVSESGNLVSAIVKSAGQVNGCPGPDVEVV